MAPNKLEGLKDWGCNPILIGCGLTGRSPSRSSQQDEHTTSTFRTSKHLEKVKVLGPKNMGEITPNKWRKRRFPWFFVYLRWSKKTRCWDTLCVVAPKSLGAEILRFLKVSSPPEKSRRKNLLKCGVWLGDACWGRIRHTQPQALGCKRLDVVWGSTFTHTYLDPPSEDHPH